MLFYRKIPSCALYKRFIEIYVTFGKRTNAYIIIVSTAFFNSLVFSKTFEISMSGTKISNIKFKRLLKLL